MFPNEDTRRPSEWNYASPYVVIGSKNDNTALLSMSSESASKFDIRSNYAKQKAKEILYELQSREMRDDEQTKILIHESLNKMRNKLEAVGTSDQTLSSSGVMVPNTDHNMEWETFHLFHAIYEEARRHALKELDSNTEIKSHDKPYSRYDLAQCYEKIHTQFCDVAIPMAEITVLRVETKRFRKLYEISKLASVEGIAEWHEDRWIDEIHGKFLREAVDRRFRGRLMFHKM